MDILIACHNIASELHGPVIMCVKDTDGKAKAYVLGTDQQFQDFKQLFLNRQGNTREDVPFEHLDAAQLKQKFNINSISYIDIYDTDIMPDKLQYSDWAQLHGKQFDMIFTLYCPGKPYDNLAALLKPGGKYIDTNRNYYDMEPLNEKEIELPFFFVNKQWLMMPFDYGRDPYDMIPQVITAMLNRITPVYVNESQPQRGGQRGAQGGAQRGFKRQRRHKKTMRRRRTKRVRTKRRHIVCRS